MALKTKKSPKDTLEKDGNIVKIVGVKVNSTEFAEVLRKIEQKIEQNKKIFVATPNTEFIVFANKHHWFKEILNRADISIADGMGLVWASKRQLTERISGTDLMEKLCQLAAEKNWSVYLLGGEPGIARRVLERLKERFPGLKGWAETGPELVIGHWDLGLVEKWVGEINEKKPTFLFVAFGMGKQEKFIWDNWGQLKVKLAMGVGGAFDYISGKNPRAPVYIRNLGFEWFYRLIHEPWRWKRQLSLVKFVWLIISLKLLKKLK